MSDCVGWIVRAKAGRDKDGSFCVIGRSGEYLLLADGKRRRVDRGLFLYGEPDLPGLSDGALGQHCRCV